jgi:hypothetical protein
MDKHDTFLVFSVDFYLFSLIFCFEHILPGPCSLPFLKEAKNVFL